MKTFRNILMCCLLLQGALLCTAQNTALPNIVIIMADDLGYGDLSCYGATKIETPAIDSLASRGIAFTDAHSASSLCSPSRYSLMTGRYPWRTRLKSGVLTWFAQPLIDSGRSTVASMLRNDGYHTVAIGKWHLGFDWPLKDTVINDAEKQVFNSWEIESQHFIDFSKELRQGPVDRGFDYFFGISASNNMIPFTFIENDRVVSPPILKKDYDYDTDQRSLKSREWNLETMDHVLCDKAIDKINEHFAATPKKPLFLYFATSAIHRPCLPTTTKGQSQAGLRGDMVVEFDNLVRRIVAALEANHALANTLLIITSDNGAVPGDAYLSLKRYKDDLGDKLYLSYFDNFQPRYPNPTGRAHSRMGWLTYDHFSSGAFRGFKADAWEGGHRIPLIVHWPAYIKAGRKSEAMICNTDFFATFSELSGRQLQTHEAEDSYSFLSILTGTTRSAKRQSMVLVAGGSGAYIVRTDEWKYIEAGPPGWGQTFYPDGPSTTDFQLYNLNQDPGEDRNLFNSQSDVVNRMKTLLKRVQTGSRVERLRVTNPSTTGKNTE